MSASEKMLYFINVRKILSIRVIGCSKFSKHLLTGLRSKQTLSQPAIGMPFLSKRGTITCPILSRRWIEISAAFLDL